MSEVLVVVSVQNDHFKNGKDPAKAPVDVLELNQVIEAHNAVVFLKNWREAGVCAKNTPGSMLHPQLEVPNTAVIVHRVNDAPISKARELHVALQAMNAKSLVLCGYFLDTGVRDLAVWAVGAGYEVRIVTAFTPPTSGFVRRQTEDELKQYGVTITK